MLRAVTLFAVAALMGAPSLAASTQAEAKVTALWIEVIPRYGSPSFIMVSAAPQSNIAWAGTYLMNYMDAQTSEMYGDSPWAPVNAEASRSGATGTGSLSGNGTLSGSTISAAGSAGAGRSSQQVIEYTGGVRTPYGDAHWVTIGPETTVNIYALISVYISGESPDGGPVVRAEAGVNFSLGTCDSRNEFCQGGTTIARQTPLWQGGSFEESYTGVAFVSRYNYLPYPEEVYFGMFIHVRGQGSAAVVPEPNGALMLLAGLAVVPFCRKRRLSLSLDH